MDNIHVVKKTTLTVEKKPLVLVLPYLGSISLQTRTKLKKSLKNILNCCKLQIVFKNRISKDLTFGVVYKFQYGPCNEPYYGECVRHFNVRIGEHMSISLLTKNKLSLRTALWPIIYYFVCNHSTSCDAFSILMRENKKAFTRIEREAVQNGR